MGDGDAGENVFEDDKNRYAWTIRLEKAHGRFGWRVHAWVLMGNHLHNLLKTPESNPVAGMTWVLGVFSQGSNRAWWRRFKAASHRCRAMAVTRKSQ
jgi:putative transposase